MPILYKPDTWRVADSRPLVAGNERDPICVGYDVKPHRTVFGFWHEWNS